MPARAARCDRARGWISLQVDGELSELERVLLEGHVARCGACRAFRVDVRGISRQLRHAPLEPLQRPIVLPRRARVSVRTLQLAAAAVAVVAVAAGTSLGLITAGRSSGGSLGRSLRPAYLDSSQYEMKLIRQTRYERLLAAIARAN